MTSALQRKLPPLWMLVMVFMAVYGAVSVGLTKLFGLPWRMPLPLPVAFGVGGPLVVIGAVILVLAFRALSVRRALGAELFADRAESKLITGGIYARTRNPLYLAVTILLLGWCVALRLTPLAFLTVIFFIHFLFVAKWEEKELQSRFGREYENYTKRVPLLVPRFRNRDSDAAMSRPM